MVVKSAIQMWLGWRARRARVGFADGAGVGGLRGFSLKILPTERSEIFHPARVRTWAICWQPPKAAECMVWTRWRRTSA